MENASPEYAAVITALNRCQLPELAVYTVECIAHAFRIAHDADPDLTAQQFIEVLLHRGAISWLDDYIMLRRAPTPAHHLIRTTAPR